MEAAPEKSKAASRKQRKRNAKSSSPQVPAATGDDEVLEVEDKKETTIDIPDHPREGYL